MALTLAGQNVAAIPLGYALPRTSSNLPGWSTPEKGPGLRPASSLFGLAPGGVYRAASVAGRAVGSYPTLSPLPYPSNDRTSRR